MSCFQKVFLKRFHFDFINITYLLLFHVKKKKIFQHFWTYVYSTLNQILSNDKSIDLPECKNPELFCLWLIYHLTLLYGYSKDGKYKLPSERVINIIIDFN